MTDLSRRGNTQTRRRTRRTRQAPSSERASSTPPDHVGLLVAAFLMMAVGWGGLYYLVTSTLPRIGGQLWLFFALLLVAVTGTALPIIRYFNVRFTPLDKEVTPGGVIVRQSVWLGLFVVTCAWLLIPRALSLPLAVFLAMVFIVVEVFLRTREISAEREQS